MRTFDVRPDRARQQALMVCGSNRASVLLSLHTQLLNKMHHDIQYAPAAHDEGCGFPNRPEEP